MNISNSSESSAENIEPNFNDSKDEYDNLNETSKTAESRVGLENMKSGQHNETQNTTLTSDMSLNQSR